MKTEEENLIETINKLISQGYKLKLHHNIIEWRETLEYAELVIKKYKNKLTL